MTSPDGESAALQPSADKTAPITPPSLPPAALAALKDGFAALDAGELERAAAWAGEARKRAPRHPGGHYLHGQVLLRRGDPRGALGAFEQAERMGGPAPALIAAQAEALAGLGRPAKAAEAWRRAAAIDPLDGAMAYRAAQGLIGLDEVAAALPLLLRAVELDPSRPEILNDLGTALRTIGRPGDAIPAYEMALRLRPDYARAESNLGVALMESGRVARAIEVLERAAAREPRNPVVRGNLAHARLRAGDAAGAVALFEELAERDKGSAQARLDLGLARQAAGDLLGAAIELGLAAELAPADPRPAYAQGECARAAGDITAATAHYRRALELDPSDRAGAALGLALVGAGPTPDAAPAAYVAELFDGYAPRFDTELTGALSYQAPQILRALADRIAPGRRFAAALDLGCGTGLGARAFADRLDAVDGVDLSPKMVAAAKARGLYRSVTTGDVVEALRARAPGSVDLLLAADVLVYLGDLAPLMTAAATALAVGGLMLLTVEALEDDPAGWRLHDGWRYAHGADHLRGLAAAVGLDVLALEPCATRTQHGRPTPSFAVALARP